MLRLWARGAARVAQFARLAARGGSEQKGSPQALLWLVRGARWQTTATLRPYQMESIDAIHNALDRHKRPAISLPTGSGKTRIFSYLLKNVRPMFTEDVARRKVLVLVNRKELIDQAAATIALVHPDLRVSIVHASREYDPTADVVVSTYQSLTSRSRRLYELNPAEFKLVIIDEAHHSVTDSYFKVLEYFDAVGPRPEPEPEPEPATYFEDLSSAPKASPRASPAAMRRADNPARRVHVVGFSATFWRNDEAFLSDVYDEVSFHESVDRMITDGFLCPGRVQQVYLPDELAEGIDEMGPRRLSARDFFLGNLEASSAFVYDVWAGNRAKYGHTVIFGSSTAHIEALTNEFRRNGVDARLLTGSMPKAARHATIEAFKHGEFPVLLNCLILTEGTDIPCIDQIIIARGVQSKGLTMQIVGRGLRLHPGKTHCNIVVFPNFQRAADGGFLPMLENTVRPRPRGEESEEPGKKLRPPREFTDYRAMLSQDAEFTTRVLASSEYAPESPLQSPLQWICWKGTYYLFLRDKNWYCCIDRRKSSTGERAWHFAQIVRITKRFTQRKEAFMSKSLSEATQYADQYLQLNLLRREWNTVVANAKWLSEPVTSNQLAFLSKHEGLDLSRLRRGSASHLISLRVIGCKLTQPLVDTVVDAMATAFPQRAEEARPVRSTMPAEVTRKPEKNWRLEPASSRQIAYLETRYPKLDFGDLSRGAASELISLMHDGDTLDQETVQSVQALAV